MRRDSLCLGHRENRLQRADQFREHAAAGAGREFLRHVPDRYRHNVRYFGLRAPRVKCQTHDAVFALLGQERLGKPRRLRWATSMQKCFGVDPLVDRNGRRMRWARRVPPAQPALAAN